jgi:hypothetical protein
MRVVAVSFFLVFLSTRLALAAEWHNSFGIGVIDANDKVEDIYRNNLQFEGKNDTDFQATLDWGYFYQPYYLYDNGFAFGLGIATPTGIFADEILVTFPVHIDIRYFLSLHSELSAYIRAGMRYNVAFGEYVEGSKPGAIAGIGLLFKWNENTKVGVEFTDDSSEIEIKDIANNRNESINLNQTIISLIFAF